MNYALLTLTVVLLLQTIMLGRAERKLRKLDKIEDRLRRLTEATALLADTTEAGLSSLGAEVSRLSTKRAAPRAATQAALTKRIVAATKKGESVNDIAGHESLSESEINLHLALARDAKSRVGKPRISLA